MPQFYSFIIFKCPAFIQSDKKVGAHLKFRTVKYVYWGDKMVRIRGPWMSCLDLYYLSRWLIKSSTGQTGFIRCSAHVLLEKWKIITFDQLIKFSNLLVHLSKFRVTWVSISLIIPGHKYLQRSLCLIKKISF